jgi:hypothetical protein
MTPDDQYLKRLDSLARFYNSQITAHVGYQISVTVGLLATLLTFSSIGVQLLDKHTPYWIVVIVFDGVCLFLYFSLPRPSFVFRYLLGTTQYYQEMSYIVFEHMGLRSRNGDGDFKTLKDRALRRKREDKSGKTCEGMEGGIEKAVMSLLEARLFVSKCQEIETYEGVQTLQGRLERISKLEELKCRGEMKNLGEFLKKVFDITPKEREVIIRDIEVKNEEGRVIRRKEKWYDEGIIIPTRLCDAYRQSTLLFLAHREPSSPGRGTCLKHVFDC